MSRPAYSCLFGLALIASVGWANLKAGKSINDETLEDEKQCICDLLPCLPQVVAAVIKVNKSSDELRVDTQAAIDAVSKDASKGRVRGYVTPGNPCIVISEKVFDDEFHWGKKAILIHEAWHVLSGGSRPTPWELAAGPVPPGGAAAMVAFATGAVAYCEINSYAKTLTFLMANEPDANDPGHGAWSAQQENAAWGIATNLLEMCKALIAIQEDGGDVNTPLREALYHKFIKCRDWAALLLDGYNADPDTDPIRHAGNEPKCK